MPLLRGCPDVSGRWGGSHTLRAHAPLAVGAHAHGLALRFSVERKTVGDLTMTEVLILKLLPVSEVQERKLGGP